MSPHVETVTYAEFSHPHDWQLEKRLAVNVPESCREEQRGAETTLRGRPQATQSQLNLLLPCQVGCLRSMTSSMIVLAPSTHPSFPE